MPPENTSCGAKDHLPQRRFGDESERPKVERPHNVVAILLCGDDDDRNRGMTLAKLGEYAEAVPAN